MTSGCSRAKPDAELALIEGMNHVMRIVPNDVKRQLASYKDPQSAAGQLSSGIANPRIYPDGLRSQLSAVGGGDLN
jgi:hypothetical protein